MGDKQPDDEGQQAQGGEVEVKAVGQPLQAAVVAGGLQLKARGKGRGQWPWRPRQQQPRQLPGRLQQHLGMADIHHDHARRQVWHEDKGRQPQPFTADRVIGGAHAQLLQGVRTDPGLPRCTDERLQVEVLRVRAGNSRCRWQAQWLDTQHANTAWLLAGEAQAALQYRRSLPAQLAQLQVERLVEPLTVTRHQLRVQRPRHHCTGAGIVIACLAVQRLDASPQCRGQPQPGQDAETLQAMAPPVAQQRLQGNQQGAHRRGSGCTRPACRTQRCCRCAARR
ncbi:hypothetical protein D3C77_319560 [compost metagenome]